MFRRSSVVVACLFLAGAACASEPEEELFGFTGVVVEVREGEAPQGVEPDADGNTDKTGAVVVRVDGGAENAGFGECATASEPNQTVFFTPGTTFLPQTVPDEAGFPGNLQGKRVGADGPLHRDGDECVALADRFRVSQEDGDGAAATASPAATTTPGVTGSPSVSATPTPTPTSTPTPTP